MRRSLSNIGKIRRRIFATIIVLLGGVVGIATAASSLIRLQVSVDKSEITIGDRITYTLIIQHAPGVRIEQPGPGANLGQFEIKDFKIYPPVKTDTLITQKYEYQISVFDTGTYVIPPFPVAFAASDTARKYQIIRSEPLKIYVRSVLADGERKLVDIKPPQPIPFPYLRFAIYGAVILGIIALVLGIYFYRKHRQQLLPFLKPEKVRPAHEIALEELEQFKAQLPSLLAGEQFKPIFTEISTILRRYLENRYFISALEETTAEIKQSLQELHLLPEEQQLALEVLQLADMVKFARYVPEREEIDGAIHSLENFIHKTKVVAGAPETEAEQGADGETVVTSEVATESIQQNKTINNSETWNQSDGGEKGD